MRIQQRDLCVKLLSDRRWVISVIVSLRKFFSNTVNIAFEERAREEGQESVSYYTRTKLLMKTF